YVVQDVKLSKRAWGGAPRSGWNATVHGPPTVASVLRFTLGASRAGAAAARRNTTNTEPYGSRRSGTVVRPPSARYAAGSVSPVSGCHSSASFPATRKLAATSAACARWLLTK